MKQYLNFADNGNGTRTEQAQYIFTEFVPTHRDNGNGGTDTQRNGKTAKKHRLPNGQTVLIWQTHRSWIPCTMF